MMGLRLLEMRIGSNREAARKVEVYNAKLGTKLNAPRLFERSNVVSCVKIEINK
jgi:hypothetical protein